MGQDTNIKYITPQMCFDYLLAQKLGIEVPHKVVTGINKGQIKKQIRELKAVRDKALKDKDRAELKRVRRKLHRLRRRLRKAIHLT